MATILNGHVSGTAIKFMATDRKQPHGFYSANDLTVNFCIYYVQEIEFILLIKNGFRDVWMGRVYEWLQFNLNMC